MSLSTINQVNNIFILNFKRIFYRQAVCYTIFVRIVLLLFLFIIFNLYAEDNNETDITLRSRFYKSFGSKIFVFDKSAGDSLQILQQQFNYDYFKQYDNLIVRTISFIIIDPFGNVSQNEDKNWLTKGKEIANHLHRNTRDYIVKNHLLFKEGDLIDPFLFAESERYLRQNAYIFDAGILIDKVDGQYADIVVFVHDVWSFQLSGNYNLQNEKGTFKLKEVNLAGFGGTLSLILKKDPSYKRNFKPDFEYSFARLFDKYGVGKVYYQSDLDHIQYGFGANQSYLQGEMNFLGGFNFDFYKTSDLLISPDTCKINLNYREQDFWTAYNFSFDSGNEVYSRYKHIVISSRLVQTVYHKEVNTNHHYYQDNVFLLLGITLLNRSFYQDSYLFSLGKTEDIPIGKKIEIVFGREFQSKPSRDYFGVSSTSATYFNSVGYILSNIRFGSYLDDSQWDHGILDLQNIYFSNLYYFYYIKIRHYIALRYSKVINPFNNKHMLTLNNEIRGLKNYQYNGDKRMIYSMENNIYLPFTLFGFNTAFVSFADLALISGAGDTIIKNPLISSLGIGFRFKNEKLVFPTIQLTLAFIPDSDNMGTDPYHFFTEKTNFYQLDKMFYQKPQIYEW